MCIRDRCAIDGNARGAVTLDAPVAATVTVFVAAIVASHKAVSYTHLTLPTSDLV